MRLPRPVPLLSSALFLCLLEKIDAVVHSGGPKGATSAENYKLSEPDFTIQKVSFTQKGYIQFLRYTSVVPTLTDYTFCIWVKSNNLTYNHPLLSYSKHEEERLVRVWISEKGKYLSLEIFDLPIFKVAINAVENVWYHLCQSWSAQQGEWELYINGKLKSGGFVPKLRGVPITGGGDIVVGQEYTDFDKGLDDGIEGDVFGFNFILSPTSASDSRHANPIKLHNYPLRRHFDGKLKSQPHTGKLLNTYQAIGFNKHLENNLIENRNLNTREVFPVAITTSGRSRRNIYQDVVRLFQAEAATSHIPVLKHIYRKTPVQNEVAHRRIQNKIILENPKPLGLLLVELSFDCGFKKGAPLAGRKVLISWTKSAVRVYGGAILTNVPLFCRAIDS